MRTTAVADEPPEERARRRTSAAEPAPLRAGDVVDDRYRLEEKLGEGGTGVVWRAHHLQMQCPVALKILLPRLRDRGAALERFWQEARLMGELGHPNIVRVLDVSPPAAPVPYMAMELLESDCLYRHTKKVGRLEIDEACRLMDGVLSALIAAHGRGIVHRDIKPENLMFAKVRDIVTDEERAELKILDFGASILMRSDGQNNHEGLLGTPYYMSPEQAGGLAELDHRTDLYSAAVVLYELLSGHLPHVGAGVHALVYSIATEEATPIARWRPDLPEGFHGFFRKALAMDPDARFQSAAEQRSALRRLSSGLSSLNRHTQLYMAVVDVEAMDDVPRARGRRHSSGGRARRGAASSSARHAVGRSRGASGSHPRARASGSSSRGSGSQAGSLSESLSESLSGAQSYASRRSSSAYADASMSSMSSMSSARARDSSLSQWLLSAAVLGVFPGLAVQQYHSSLPAPSENMWRDAALAWLATMLLVSLFGWLWGRRARAAGGV